MASIKLALPVALLLCGFMVIGSIESTEAKQGKVCAMYCEDAEYMMCPSTGSKQLPPACNCCLADKNGCTIYLRNKEVRNCT